MTGTIRRWLRPMRWLTVVGATVVRKERRLRMVEMVSLGDKRFAAILQVDGEQFLVGGGAGSIALLARLESPPAAPNFAEVLQNSASRAYAGEEILA